MGPTFKNNTRLHKLTHSHSLVLRSVLTHNRSGSIPFTLKNLATLRVMQLDGNPQHQDPGARCVLNDSFAAKKAKLSGVTIAGVVMGAIVAGLLLHFPCSSSSPEESTRPRARGGAGTTLHTGSGR
jgi:hypothetical protein